MLLERSGGDRGDDDGDRGDDDDGEQSVAKGWRAGVAGVVGRGCY